MKRVVKNLAIDLLGQSWVARLVAAASGPSCVAVMMHRFKHVGHEPESESWGHDPRQLRAVLAALRSAGIAVVDLDTAVMAFRAGRSVEEVLGARLAVAFTVDDGYIHSYEAAAPVFAEFDCPVTGFVVPEAVEGRCWFWWDRVSYVLRHASRSTLTVTLAGDVLELHWTDVHGRRVVHAALCDRLKAQPTDVMEPFIEELARVAEVELPATVPLRDRAMNWEQMQQAERRGWRFGAHSMTHPVLSRCDDGQSEHEVRASVAAVQRHLGNPSKIFCYPVGRAQDFGARERGYVRAAGLDMAITAIPGVIRGGMEHRHGTDWPLLVPRFSYDARVGGIPRMFLG